MMRGILFALGLLLLGTPVCAGEIYKWRDGEGKLRFSDRPPHIEAEKHAVFTNDSIPPVGRAAGPKDTSQFSGKPLVEKKITAADYVIKPRLEQKDGHVVLSGRIEYGPRCGDLRVEFRAQSENGARARIVDTISDMDHHRSDLLEGRARVRGGSDQTRWEVTDIWAECRDPG